MSNYNKLELVGLLFLFYVLIYRPLKLLIRILLNNICYFNGKSERILKPGADSFSVVTGATDGIGLEYGRQLAEKGYSLVLISRTEEKLRRVAGEIRESYPQCKKIEILAADFTRTDIYDRIKQQLESLSGPIHVLVNNVGMSYHIPEYFTAYPEGHHLRLINTNVVSVTAMSEIMIKIMLNQPYDPNLNPARGVIINISSAISLTEFPLFSTYGAGKKYMNYLSNALATEYSDKKILFQCIPCNQVNTKMVSTELSNPIMGVTPQEFVKFALKTIGAELQTSGHPKHKFFNSIFGVFEWFLCDSWYMKIKLAIFKQVKEDYERKVGAAASNDAGPENVTTEIPLLSDVDDKSGK